MILHNLDPVYNENSRVLILGSFPSVRSREEGFFYGHPNNRFWKVLSLVFEEEIPNDIEKKREFLLRHNIALWDVIASCDVEGSADVKIKNAVPNDISHILSSSGVKTVFLNGKTAEKYYNKYMQDRYSVERITLPSTSPANASWSQERLCGEWKEVKKRTEKE